MFDSVFLRQNVTPLQIVYPDTALRLQALLDFEQEGGEKRVAGDEWLFEGPGTLSQNTEYFLLLRQISAQILILRGVQT